LNHPLLSHTFSGLVLVQARQCKRGSTEESESWHCTVQQQQHHQQQATDLEFVGKV
jgi:hypothetical protein